ncbi:MAG: hypothetical protein JWO37_2366 [Acidimicrobiales bacterium]|nr:hypothetical protein [Acidimicrobiales bacterium]
MNGRWVRGAALAVARHPALWPTAAGQLLRLARPGWWRRWPPVPAPDEAYLRFRLQTAYGDPDRPPEPADVVTYLRWCRSTRDLLR